MATPTGVCAATKDDAIARATVNGITILKPHDPSILSVTCQTRGSTTIGYSGVPGYRPLDLPSCDPSGADDACVACAKASCCGQYQACSQDSNCSCLVGCLYQGNTVAACTAADTCGSPSSVSISTAACLDASCSSECTNPGAMGPGMCPTTTGTGTGGGTTTQPCTPGSFGAGDACSSDGDCASCICNAQTLTCD